MLRKLVDYKKLDHSIVSLLIETYPHGYGDDDIIIFKNLNGEIIETVELKTEDTIYLVKISKSLSNFIANFEDNVEKEIEPNTTNVLEEVDSSEMQLDIDSDSLENEIE
ncbi:hypothetical protein [uncultured Maribacter sp.]|uniref:hypothetical protein n=1 Tax=uncultured Maribacter sp. TaxID=431308 RepID=UPI0026271DC4|nr:hypothetical protein [uncultured Maribacter sp.]